MANEDPLESLQCGTCGTPDCTWIEYPYNPVYEPVTSAYYQTVRYDQTAFTPFGPSAFYKMWYDSSSAGGIDMATSPDGINWMFNSNMTGLTSTARHSRVLFSRDGFGTNTPYRIWYWDSPNPYITGPEPQMIRTARSVDGVIWTNDTNITQDPSDPLLPFSIYNGSYGPADILYFPQNSPLIDKTDPCNNRYVMYYDVTNGAIEEIALAVSGDGVFWARIGNQPVLPRGGPGQWDANYACEGAVVVCRLAPNLLKMWYSGGVVSSREGIGCATSTDGINWTKYSGNPVFSIFDGVAWRAGRSQNPWVLFDSLRFSGHGDSVCYKFWMTGGPAFTFLHGDGDPGDHPDIGYATQPEPCLSISKSASLDLIALGENITYSITIANSGTGTAINVSMIDTLPPNVTLVSVMSSQGTWTQSGNSLVFHFGNITPNANVAVQIIVTPTVVGTITNTAEVNGLIATATTTVASFLAANESECIIAEKVYASCQQRECFPSFAVILPDGVPPFNFISITFGNGVIVQSTIIITPIPSRPNFSRVQFAILIPYTLRLKDSVGQTFILTGNLPDISKDIVMYSPPTRPEFDLSLRVETRTEIVASPIFTSTTVQLALGSFVVTKVTGLVQLLIPSFGYCPEPCECEEFQPQNPCIVFFDTNVTPFPIDFFPPQLDTAVDGHQ